LVNDSTGEGAARRLKKSHRESTVRGEVVGEFESVGILLLEVPGSGIYIKKEPSGDGFGVG
jgi:hypothetical protein